MARPLPLFFFCGFPNAWVFIQESAFRKAESPFLLIYVLRQSDAGVRDSAVIFFRFFYSRSFFQPFFLIEKKDGIRGRIISGRILGVHDVYSDFFPFLPPGLAKTIFFLNSLGGVFSDY